MTAARPVAPAPSTTAFSSSISLHRVTITTVVVSVVSPSAAAHLRMAMEIQASLTVTILSIRGPPVARAFTPTVGTVRPGQWHSFQRIVHVSTRVYIVCLH